ncbi:deleted in malignant brain tumors 1 protein-like isoform X1 [Ostrea edulis]|uniref:deleted in malignant brain tumors 1 protein-like isoform X1 n=1 Tax=Ostrea edulis TaxID=37623 RepID=UPI002095E1FE|nr:deleted in malignant brain tumors 1 protein-like isoform X1 [Ostrea edulis]
MYRKTFIRFVSLVFFTFQHDLAKDLCIPPSGDRYISKRLPVVPFTVLFNVGIYSCFKQCEAYAICLSINFNRIQFMCELNSQKRNETLYLVDDGNFIYKEIPDIFDYRDKRCGNLHCNHFSKCVRTKFKKYVCLAIGCDDSVPVLGNGAIVKQTFSPPLVTFECDRDYTGVGTNNTISCVPGGKWPILSYRCEYSGQTGLLRLENGNSTHEGRVEIYINGQWGTVCDDLWTDTEASVVCKMLGYTGLSTSRSEAYFGKGTGPIWLDNVKCSGSEHLLLECNHNTIGSHNCGHLEDAGVTCK